MTAHRPRRLRLLVAALAGLLLLTGATMAVGRLDTEPAQLGKGSGAAKPTIVLVHGAFADSSGWNDRRRSPAAATATPSSRSPTRCAGRSPMPSTCASSCRPSRGRSCWSGTPTAVR